MSQNTVSLKKNIFLNTLYQILIVIAPLLTAPYISRILENDGVGVYSYTTSLVTYFTMFAALGTVSYGTRMIAMHRDDKNQYSKLFWEIELLTVITSILMLSIWIVLSCVYAEYRVLLFILSFHILATCFDISWLYAGLEKYKYTVSVNAFFKILSIVFIFVFVKNKNDTWLFILINSSALFLGNLSMWIFLPKTVSRSRVKFNTLKCHFKETMVYFIPTIATTIYTVLDKTLIGLLIPGEITIVENGNEVVKKISEIENGYYEQATKILNIIKAVCFVSINGVMSSRASYLYGKDDESKVKEHLFNTMDITMLLSIGAAFGIACVASVFVPIFFGNGYDKTILLLKVMAVIVPIICMSNTLGSIYYTPSGRRKQSSIYLIIGSLVNLILNIPLIIFYKSVGAAIASIIAELVISFLYILRCNRMLQFKDLIRILWKKILSGLIMGGTIVLLNHYLANLNSYLLLLIEILLGIVIYFVCLLVMRDRAINKFIDVVKRRFRNEDRKKTN